MGDSSDDDDDLLGEIEGLLNSDSEPEDVLNEIEGLEDKEIGEVGASLIWNF